VTVYGSSPLVMLTYILLLPVLGESPDIL